MIEVFWASGSCNSWCVLLALTIKRVPYASHLLQLSKQEHKTPEYLALNPRGKVPCIRDGEIVLYESLAIVAYLDRKVPEPPLFGDSPAEAGLIVRLVSEDRYYFEPKLDALLLPFYRGKAAEVAHTLPERAAGVHEDLARFEALLAGRDYLAGSRPSAADLSFFPHLQHLIRAIGRPEYAALRQHFDTAHYPNLMAWTARIELLPGFEHTYPPHWRG